MFFSELASRRAGSALNEHTHFWRDVAKLHRLLVPSAFNMDTKTQQPSKKRISVECINVNTYQESKDLSHF